jgi:hypothetical protein
MIRHDGSLGTLAAAALLSGLLAGCGPGAPPPAAPPFSSPQACGEEIAGRETLTAPLVLVGEIHGTREIPATFGRLVCQTAAERRGGTVLVGVEIASSGQSAIDAFLAGAGGAAATRALLAQQFWQRDYQDGRSSEAMLHLLDDLRRYRNAGLKVVVRALDPELYDSPGDRDAGMSATLIAAIAAVRPAKTLVMVGNVHSRTLHGYPWDAKAAYLPLGALLRARYDDLIALDVAAQGGFAWTCASAAPADCGAHPMRAREATGPVPRIALDPAAAARTGYSGTLFLGQVTASAPARLEIPAAE